MITFYYHNTPNARKVLMMLEELGEAYDIAWTDITRGDQFKPEFLRVNPNGKVPAIVDRDGPGGKEVRVFESGAILLYLAEKYGRLLSGDPSQRVETVSWVYWQTGSQGPMCGQAAHFISHAQKGGIDIPYAKERYLNEAKRTYASLDAHLSDRDCIVGDFSIADLALFPWTRVAQGHGIDMAAYPHVARWSSSISSRPSAKVKPVREDGMTPGSLEGNYDREQRQILFGAHARSRPMEPFEAETRNCIYE